MWYDSESGTKSLFRGVTSFANNSADLLYKMQQQPATRGWLRRDLLAKGLNFPQDLTVGHQVYARHPESGEYCLGNVTDNSKAVTYYSVVFNDGTSSHDTYPEDILNYNCTEDGPPPIGAAVEFMCFGKRHVGYLRSISERQLYTLSFLDGEGTVVTAERQEFYHPDEGLPSDLKNKLDKPGYLPQRTRIDP
ncbi:lysine-specific demethylase 4C-like isoform X2 [Daphnia pulex]|uniref:lysine-specific demethylase 4C-like isoform X2 n=1 Tax=Daphnia pulex TaxID=6669 RepID=UPI001EDF5CA3|nr:lysine-specific demethylase 4C-like isoform X2 [Daphnia pulex]